MNFPYSVALNVAKRRLKKSKFIVRLRGPILKLIWRMCIYMLINISRNPRLNIVEFSSEFNEQFRSFYLSSGYHDEKTNWYFFYVKKR